MGEGEVEDTARMIHSELHRLRPDARCVLHTHMPFATSLTLLEDGRLLPVSQSALRFIGDVSYDEAYGGLVLDVSEARRIAAALGSKRVLFLSNHGVIVVGPEVSVAFDDLYYLERACELQVRAMSTGAPLRHISDDVIQRTVEQFRQARVPQARQHFAAIRRLLRS